MRLKIQKLHCDNGRKYTYKAFKQVCERNGIERFFLTPYALQ